MIFFNGTPSLYWENNQEERLNYAQFSDFIRNCGVTLVGNIYVGRAIVQIAEIIYGIHNLQEENWTEIFEKQLTVLKTNKYLFENFEFLCHKFQVIVYFINNEFISKTKWRNK